MDIKTQGIVLRTVKFGDNKLIIDILTREEGRMSVVWKISTSRNAKVRRQFFQPLTILEIEASRSPRQQMAILKEARLAEAYATIPFDPIKLSLTFFIAEFLHYATQSMHTDATCYDFISHSLVWLDNADREVANFHLMFMIRMSLFLGFLPDMSSYSEGFIFNLRDGSFSAAAPLHPDFLVPSDAKKMQTLMRMSPSNLHLFPMSRHDRNRIVDFILQYYRLHIPAFGEMKSLQVLREL